MTTPTQPTANLPAEVRAKGVSIILYRAGKFAVSQRLSTLRLPCLWQFPGGHVEPDELPIVAAMRELREETGLDLHAARFTFIDKAGPLKGYKGELYVGYRFGVVLNADEEPLCTEPDKHTEWSWADPLELAGRDMLQATKEYAYLFALCHASQPPLSTQQAEAAAGEIRDKLPPGYYGNRASPSEVAAIILKHAHHTAVKPMHTAEEDFQHYLTYSGLRGENEAVINARRHAFYAACSHPNASQKGKEGV